MLQRVLCFVLVAWLPVVAIADTVTLPAGTVVFCALDERVTSKKKQTSEGDMVRARVWKDVFVDGRLVIRAWTPVYVQVAKVKKAKVAGIKGKLELEALNVTTVDQQNVALSGGYDQSGRGRMGLSIALAAVVAWPLIFIKGKQAVLEAGTVFDAVVRHDVDVRVPERDAPKLRVAPDLEFAILYDEMSPDEKIRDLPLELRLLEGEVASAEVTSVNGETIAALPIEITGPSGDDAVRGVLDFRTLSKHFSKGMNRFDVQAGEETVEVLLEIEL